MPQIAHHRGSTRRARAVTLAGLMALALPAAAQTGDTDARRMKPGWAVQQATPDGESVLLDGRLRPRDGELLSGTGQFKFVLYRRDGNGAERQFWNSARGRVAGLVAEPDASVNVPVRAGRFSLRLGDEVSTPPLPMLDDARIALPTPWVRIWWREPDGVFRVQGPDLPIDAAPLAREAALAGDADRLGGREPGHFLSRENHQGPEPLVEYVHQYIGGRQVTELGCRQMRVEITVNAPSDGTLVVLGHANIGGRISGNCYKPTSPVEVCPPIIPAPGLPTSFPPPAGNPATGVPPLPKPPVADVPGTEVPPRPSFRSRGAAGRGLPAAPCLAAEVPNEHYGERNYARGYLYLLRHDVADPAGHLVSASDIQILADVASGRRMDVSATFDVKRGPVRVEMIASNVTDGGFSEHNLTAMFFPTRANSSRPAP